MSFVVGGCSRVLTSTAFTTPDAIALWNRPVITLRHDEPDVIGET